MNGQVFLIRYGEIALKSKYVRKQLVQKLIDNIKTHFSVHNQECFITSDYGRIYLYCDNVPLTEKILGMAFGLVSFSLCTETSSELANLVEVTKKVAESWTGEGLKFAVRTRRVGTHPYSSQSLAEEIGSAILSSRKGLKVDLDEPDVEVYVEVREDKAYVFKDAVRGPGGLPLGSQGLVVAFVEEESDIAAAWLMMKRGCKVHLAHAHQNGFLDKMKIWDPKIKFFKCEDIDGLLSLCDETGAEGIALGWDAEKALKTKLKHDVPVFYPLVGLKAEEKERLVGFILGSD